MPIKGAKHNDTSIGVWIYAPTSLYYTNDQIMGIANKDCVYKDFMPNLTRMERTTCEYDSQIISLVFWIT